MYRRNPIRRVSVSNKKKKKRKKVISPGMLACTETGINAKLGRLLFREAKRKSDRHASPPRTYIRRVMRSSSGQSTAREVL